MAPVDESEGALAGAERPLSEMYFIFNGKDEREPHAFVMSDLYY